VWRHNNKKKKKTELCNQIRTSTPFEDRDINKTIQHTLTTLVLLCCGVNRLIGSLSSIEHFIAVIEWDRVVYESLTSVAQVLLPGFFFFERTSVGH